MKKATSTTKKTGRKSGKAADSPSTLIDARSRNSAAGAEKHSPASGRSSSRPTPKWSRSGSGDIPVWSHGGIICTGETYKAAVKTTFAKGAALPDPSKLFNSSLEGNTRRAIDFPEGGKINATAFKALIRAAVALNTAKPAKKKSKKA